MKTSNSYNNTAPLLFLGHGSPMNAIEENECVRGFLTMAEKLKKPKAILCISAHWETRGTYVTAMKKPRTIHDFGGFPRALYEVQYPAPGDPQLAERIKSLIHSAETGLNTDWGLDHGTWSVIKHLFPKADVPIVQLSLDYTKTALFHYSLGAELLTLREEGIMIIGSGNMIHNLGTLDWAHMDGGEYGYSWATEASDKMKKFIINNDHESLIHYNDQGKAFQMAIPTPEHYLPLLYVLALKKENESVEFFNDKIVGGSVGMCSVYIA